MPGQKYFISLYWQTTLKSKARDVSSKIIASLRGKPLNMF